MADGSDERPTGDPVSDIVGKEYVVDVLHSDVKPLCLGGGDVVLSDHLLVITKFLSFFAEGGEGGEGGEGPGEGEGEGEGEILVSIYP